MTTSGNIPPPVPGNLPPTGPAGGGSAGSQGFPTPPPPPARSGGLFTPRNIIIAIVGLLALCCVCAVALFAISAFLSSATPSLSSSSSFTVAALNLDSDQTKAAQVGIDFLTKLKSSDWPGAYNLCTPDLQKEVVSASELSKRITSGGAQPVSGVLTTFSDIAPGDADTQIDGTGTFGSNRVGTIRLVLDRAGSSWRISGFNLKPN
jgi:hypothetical protein